MATFLPHSSSVTQLQSHELRFLQQGASTETTGLSAGHIQHLQYQGMEAWPLAPRRQPPPPFSKLRCSSVQLAVSVGCITIQEQTEIHLHNYMLCPHIPISPFLCSLCPLESLRAKWGAGNIVQVFSGLCQGPVVVSRHQKGIFDIPSTSPAETLQAGPRTESSPPEEKSKLLPEEQTMNLSTHDDRSFAHNSHKVGETQASVNVWMDKQNVLYT